MAAKEQNNAFIKKETLYIAVAIAFVAGFVGGVGFATYRISSMPHTREAASPQQQAGPQIDPQTAARIMALEKEVSVNPKNLEALVTLGHLYYDSDEPAKAVNTYTKALAIDPTNADVWTDMGIMYRQLHKPEKAIEAFEEAVRQKPVHEKARFNIGIVKNYDLNDRAGALKIWKELLAMNPAFTAPNGMPLSVLIKEVESEDSPK